jgi:hypothetical protein
MPIVNVGIADCEQKNQLPPKTGSFVVLVNLLSVFPQQYSITFFLSRSQIEENLTVFPFRLLDVLLYFFISRSYSFSQIAPDSVSTSLTEVVGVRHTTAVFTLILKSLRATKNWKIDECTRRASGCRCVLRIIIRVSLGNYAKRTVDYTALIRA